MSSISLSHELIAEGYTYRDVARLARNGGLQRVRRGAYATGPTFPGEVRDVHRALIEATLRQSSPEAVVSHLSAGVLHGLPVWADSLSRVHLTRGRGHGGRRSTYIHLHSTPIEAEEVVTIDGLAATSLSRTVVDLARSLPALRAIPIGDAALALGLPPADVERALQQARGSTGVGAARFSLARCDGRSESVGESTSRVILSQQPGVPAPELQFEVFGADGQLVARSDFCWEAYRTLGEFDGKVKYGKLLKPGQTPTDVVVAEKLREDALRDLGWQVVRWTWDDLAQPRLLVERLQRAFVRGQHSAGRRYGELL